MTTHSRTRMLGAGVVMAVVAGLIAMLPAPAMAAKPTVQIVSLSNGSLKSGDQAQLTIKVTAPGASGDPDATVSIQVNSSFGELQCKARCNFDETFRAGESKTFTIELVAGNVEPGKNKSGQVQIEATVGSDTGRTDRTITVRGPDQAPMVKEITGKVRDAVTGRPVTGASVAIMDSANHKYDTTTNSSGTYRFASSAESPITPGNIDMLAKKDGFEPKYQTANGKAGESVKANFAVKSTASPSPSVTPSVTPEAAPVEAATPENLVAAPPAKTPTAGSADDGNGSMLYILLGGLLVAAGVGAMILVLMRRKDNDAEDDEPAPAVATAAAGAAVPAAAAGAYHGAPDATRIAGAPGGADATMISRGAVPPSLADAPTMLQRAVPVDPADEFPDPYGAPLPGRTPTYDGVGPGGQAGGWDNAGYAGPAGVSGGQRNPDPTRATGMMAGAAGAAGAAQINGAYRPADPAGPPAAGGGYGPAGAPGGYGPADTPGGYSPTGTPGSYGSTGAPGSYGPAGAPGGYGPPDAPGGYSPTGSPADAYGGAARADQYRPGYPPPSEPTGYPSVPGGGYGERYDEPTGRYEPPAGGYPPQGYQPDAPGYGPRATSEGYGQHAGAPHAGAPPAGPNGSGPLNGRTPGGGYEAPAGGYGSGSGSGSGGRYGTGAPAGGYESAPAPYGSPAATGYEQPAGRQPGPDAAGPAGPGGYPNGPAPTAYQQPTRFDQSTGRDQPGGYEQPTRYEQPARYDQPTGHHQPTGHEQPGGYDQTTGYAQPTGYDQRAGFDRTAPRQPAGPQDGPERGGYYAEHGQQPTSRHGAPPPAPAGGQPPIAEQRRPLDWLDD